VRAAGLSRRVQLVRGDATRLPVPSGACDAAMVAFGIRNVVDPRAALAELGRVLRPGGRLAILEFGLPRAPGIRPLYAWYFTRVLPRIGRLISKDQDAYSYLPASVSQFPSDDAFAAWLGDAGFADVGYRALVFGVVYLYTARTPDVSR
jgi:demethylmenaquinone methyltransferase/2-methoxy-6-polyprenyl-1,4-benzoquinol methylase